MISILLCTYNRERLLKESIDSILMQTYRDFELIIVDDGSTDGTRTLLESYKDDRIRLIFQEKNKFYCRTANEAIKLMKGEYLAIANSDDTWHPEKLEKQMKYLEVHPECGTCFTFANVIDENGEPADEDFPEIAKLMKQSFETREEWMRYFIIDGNCVAHPSAVIPKWMVEKLGGFHLLFCQGADLEMWIRVVRQAPIHVIPEALTNYRCHHNPENQISGADRLKTARFMNEHMIMRKKLINMLDDEELRRYFGVLFRKKDASTHLEFEIERAFILSECVKGLPKLNVLGVEKFEEILDHYQEEAVEVLEQEYQVTLKDLYQLNLQHFYVDFGVHTEKAEQIAVQQELEQKLQNVIGDMLRINGEKEQAIKEWNATKIEKEKYAEEKKRLLGDNVVLLETKASLMEAKHQLEKEKNELMEDKAELQKDLETLQNEKNDALCKLEGANGEICQLKDLLNTQEEEIQKLRKTLELQMLENIRIQETNSKKRKSL